MWGVQVPGPEGAMGWRSRPAHASGQGQEGLAAVEGRVGDIG